MRALFPRPRHYYVTSFRRAAVVSPLPLGLAAGSRMPICVFASRMIAAAMVTGNHRISHNSLYRNKIYHNTMTTCTRSCIHGGEVSGSIPPHRNLIKKILVCCLFFVLGVFFSERNCETPQKWMLDPVMRIHNYLQISIIAVNAGCVIGNAGNQTDRENRYTSFSSSKHTYQLIRRKRRKLFYYWNLETGDAIYVYNYSLFKFLRFFKRFKPISVC